LQLSKGLDSVRLSSSTYVFATTSTYNVYYPPKCISVPVASLLAVSGPIIDAMRHCPPQLSTNSNLPARMLHRHLHRIYKVEPPFQRSMANASPLYVQLPRSPLLLLNANIALVLLASCFRIVFMLAVAGTRVRVGCKVGSMDDRDRTWTIYLCLPQARSGCRRG